MKNKYLKNQIEVKLVLDIQYHDVSSMMHYDATVLLSCMALYRSKLQANIAM